ncbi:hypothetical protein [Rhodococcus sp. UNC363MFTsu5.1]|uniref:hypothetical protein n=1 Tax=Rhodococcus sp. UNC363MFTsu5.1 TaxID=1449069 RepID=UPI000690D11F|nr:hypothetical protein [Rhodococcus sp. UNC363MFTsu5.1]
MTNDVPAGLEAGASLVTAMLSPVSGGLVRTWTEGGTRLWSVDDPDGLSELLGRGLIARVSVPDDRFRETVLLDAAAGTLLVQERIPGATENTRDRAFRLGDPVRPERNPWTDLDDFLAAAAASAVERDEYWVVELGGWAAPHEPYCFFGVVDDEGERVAVIETAPVPRDTGVWPEVPDDGRPGTSVSSPASEDTIEAAGIFAVTAVESWGVAPWDVALSFGHRAP